MLKMLSSRPSRILLSIAGAVGLIGILALEFGRPLEAFPKILIIDSGFASSLENCHWVHDGNFRVPNIGECYDKSSWNSLINFPASPLTAYLTSPNKEWTEYKNSHPTAEEELRAAFDLNAHGSMVEEIVRMAATFRLETIKLRNMGSQSGTVSQANNFSLLENGLASVSPSCPLPDWSAYRFYDSEGFLEPDEARIAKLLSQNPKIRIVNISSGFRKSWIREDLPKCSEEEAEKFYEASLRSWRNLLRKFPDVLFVTSSGNEYSDFSNFQQRQDHNWATLSGEPNLILVGALNKEGLPFRASNSGLSEILWAPGDFILSQPNPQPTQALKIRFFGTSAAAPWVSGTAAKIMNKNSKISILELRKILRNNFLMPDSAQ